MVSISSRDVDRLAKIAEWLEHEVMTAKEHNLHDLAQKLQERLDELDIVIYHATTDPKEWADPHAITITKTI